MITVNVPRNRSEDYHAFIDDINTAETLSGKQCMLLINHIMKGIGVKTCSLENVSRFYYEYQLDASVPLGRASVPLITLRCIRGKTTDWYSEFGYFNENKRRIAREMERIHDMPLVNSSQSLGSLLLSLWNQTDKTDFYKAYRRHLWRFFHLKMLRDNSTWTCQFSEGCE